MVELTHISSVSSDSYSAPIERLVPNARMQSIPSERDRVLAVLDGVVYVACDEDEFVLTPGDQLTIPAGERPVIWNAGDDDARVVTEVRAAAKLRWLQAA